VFANRFANRRIFKFGQSLAGDFLNSAACDFDSGSIRGLVQHSVVARGVVPALEAKPQDDGLRSGPAHDSLFPSIFLLNLQVLQVPANDPFV